MTKGNTKIDRSFSDAIDRFPQWRVSEYVVLVYAPAIWSCKDNWKLGIRLNQECSDSFVVLIYRTMPRCACARNFCGDVYSRMAQ